MAKCKNCKHLHTLYNRREESYKWCAIVNGRPREDVNRDCASYEQLTNADRIRSMTDQELATIMCPAKFTRSDKVCDFSHECKDCTLAWLQRESEE